jgi:hypothetical protein
MEKKSRTQLVLGILLILVAAWLIATRLQPDLADLIKLPAFDWPMWVVLTGAGLLVLGLLVGAPGMAVPACIVAGIGGILYYCDLTGNWGAWTYLWTLIPGFAGIGTLLAGLLGEDLKRSLRDGFNQLVFSAIMFVIFGTFFDAWAIFGGYSAYVPIALLFLLGIWLVVRGFLRRK